MSGIFISYRRDDAGTEARRVWERLAAKLGPERVFIDVVTLEPGDDFARAIQDKVAFCDALVAVIGPHWLDSAAPDGTRRLDDPVDWVRLEVAAALGQGVRVIPALVGGARLPDARQLPGPLSSLPDRQAIAIRPDRFDADVDGLATALTGAVAGQNVITSWLALLTRRHRALDPLALERPETLWRAFKFLLLVMLVNEILRLPAAASAGLSYWNVAFIAALLAIDTAGWLALAMALHVAMRAVGGRATLQKSVVVLSYLSAWLPLIALSQAPVWGLQLSVTKEMADAGWSPGAAAEIVTRFVQHLGAFATARLLVSFVLATVLWVTLMASVFAALRTLHGLRTPPAAAAFVAGLALEVFFLAFVYAPVSGAIYAAFSR
jgi:TIR domain-containing protein